MISIEELREVGKILGIKNIGYVEKNYFHHLILLSISREIENLIFKGGTCLFLTYGLNRFSEDLDFSLIKTLNIEKFTTIIKKYLSKFGAETKIKKIKESKTTLLFDLSIKGILYTGTPNTSCNIKIDVGKLPVFLKTKQIFLHPLYGDIPSYPLKVMDEREILAEKLALLFERNDPKDVYDLWFLLKKGVKMDFSLAWRKLGEKKNKQEILNQITLFENRWKELKFFVLDLPKFEKIKKELKSYF